MLLKQFVFFLCLPVLLGACALFPPCLKIWRNFIQTNLQTNTDNILCNYCYLPLTHWLLISVVTVYLMFYNVVVSWDKFHHHCQQIGNTLAISLTFFLTFMCICLPVSFIIIFCNPYISVCVLVIFLNALVGECKYWLPISSFWLELRRIYAYSLCFVNCVKDCMTLKGQT